MYIDLPYYKENGGKEMTDAAFSSNEYRARKIVDRFTQGRVKDMQQPPEAVKRLMVELVTIEAMQGAEATQAQAVTSFTNDGYSETYAAPKTAEQIQELESTLICEYLSGETDGNGVPLLYLGVC